MPAYGFKEVPPNSKELIADGDNQILQTRDVKAAGSPRQAGDIFWIKVEEGLVRQA